MGFGEHERMQKVLLEYVGLYVNIEEYRKETGK